jgi:phosphoglycerate dehydrogenase-like enzyme
MPLSIWCNTQFKDAALARLREGVGGHRLILSQASSAAVLREGVRDRELQEADIAFGQPAVEDCLAGKRLKWIEISSAGYGRYDNDPFREALRGRGAAMTNASGVFADSCAQHALAMMLADARQLLPSHRDQLETQSWEYVERRYACRRLGPQTRILFLGYGAIGRRLAELLAPFGCNLQALRRQTRSESGVRIVSVEELTRVLPQADHVVNLLPENEATQGFMNARRFSCLKPGARFYNIGRGVTVDQRALLDALSSGRLAGAYLDVTDPEPLPPGHPLWTAPNCHITPHIAGGRADQDEALVEHFLSNLAAFSAGKTLEDRVI